jgi:hypothetical protein
MSHFHIQHNMGWTRIVVGRSRRYAWVQTGSIILNGPSPLESNLRAGLLVRICRASSQNWSPGRNRGEKWRCRSRSATCGMGWNYGVWAVWEGFRVAAFGRFGGLQFLRFGGFEGYGLRRLAGLRGYELLTFEGFGVVRDGVFWRVWC